MKYLYLWFTTCVVLPFFWHDRPPDPVTIEPEHAGVVCECCLPAQEPDLECHEWQAFHALQKEKFHIKEDWE